MGRVVFSGLTELRAFAALAVVVHHVELYLSREGLPSLFDVPRWRPFIAGLGENGVILFFTLSGFLITYLLLAERRQRGSIDIRAFYLRRVRRIWPLYFLVVVIGFAVLPLIAGLPLFDDQRYYPSLVDALDPWSLLLFVLFLSNFARVAYPVVAGAAHSWSVSVEEQFYAVWPWLISAMRRLWSLALVIIAGSAIKLILQTWVLPAPIDRWFTLVPIEYMGIGALMAVGLFSGRMPILRPWIRWSAIGVLAIAILGMLVLAPEQSAILSVLFGGFILLLAMSGFRSKPLSYLGTISYGIYMYHPLCMFLSFSIVGLAVEDPAGFHVLFAAATLVSTIGISHLSYFYVERPILRWRTGRPSSAAGR